MGVEAMAVAMVAEVAMAVIPVSIPHAMDVRCNSIPNMVDATCSMVGMDVVVDTNHNIGEQERKKEVGGERIITFVSMYIMCWELSISTVSSVVCVYTHYYKSLLAHAI